MPGSCISSPVKSDRAEKSSNRGKSVRSRVISITAQAAPAAHAAEPSKTIYEPSCAVTTPSTSTAQQDSLTVGPVHASSPLHPASTAAVAQVAEQLISETQATGGAQAVTEGDPLHKLQEAPQPPATTARPSSASACTHSKPASASSTTRITSAGHHRRNSSSASAHRRNPSGPRLPTGPEPINVDLEYLPSTALEPIDDPEAALKCVLTQLEGNDWLTCSKELTTARKLLVHHKEIMLPQMATLMPLLLKLTKNPRSALCKTAIMTAADAFKCYGDAVVPLLMQPTAEAGLLSTLLLKASSNDKKFVVEEARAAINTLAAHTCSTLLLDTLSPFVDHRSPKVRAQVAITVYEAAKSAEQGELERYGLDRILKIAGRYVTDNTGDAREAARQLLGCLISSYVVGGGTDWQSWVKSTLDASEAIAICKIQC